MPSKNPAQRLQDIIENIDAILMFTAGLDLAHFRQDRKTVYAVVRALEIISEASRRLPAELRDRHGELDWAAIAATGNVYRHDEGGVLPTGRRTSENDCSGGASRSLGCRTLRPTVPTG